MASQLHEPPAIVLYPIGVGTARWIERGPIEKYRDASWFPDSKSRLLSANEAGRPTRCYRQSIDGGLPEPVTPERVFGELSPLGDRKSAKFRCGSNASTSRRASELPVS